MHVVAPQAGSLLPRLQLTAELQTQVQQMLGEQQFLELLEAGHTSDALKHLRSAIAPHTKDLRAINRLSR